MNDWVECQSCWAEFKVVTDSDTPLAYCPLCGADIEQEDEDEEFEEDLDYDED